MPVFRAARVISLIFAAALFGWAQQTPAPAAPGGRGRGGPRVTHRPGRKNLLIWIDIRNGVQHDSVSHAAAVMERLGYDSGVYDAFIHSDSQPITKHGLFGSDGQRVPGLDLNDFDAIFFYGLREIDLTAQQRADLLSFVHDDGKGFVAAHTATTAFMSWPEFGEMLGARFDSHPWGIISAPVIIEDSSFPGMNEFHSGETLTDEMYQNAGVNRADTDVLMRLDAGQLDMKRPSVHNLNGDFPLTWAKMYGKGRVFYSALGHDRTTWDNPKIQNMYFQAVRWSLGLVPGPVQPHPYTGGVPPASGNLATAVTQRH